MRNFEENGRNELNIVDPDLKTKSNLVIEKGSEIILGMADVYDKTTGDLLGTTKIVQTLSLRFNEIPENIFEMNCEENCIDKNSTLNFLEKKHDNFNENDVVTLIFFNEVEE